MLWLFRGKKVSIFKLICILGKQHTDGQIPEIDEELEMHLVQIHQNKSHANEQ
jgi:hypothetical protein